MSETEIEAFVTARKAQGMTLGGIMAALKAGHAGAYDGKLADVGRRVLA